MSETKFTPGPWVVGNIFELTFGVKRGNGTEPIGFVYGPSLAERYDVGRTALANARLIAAAPELYEALERTLNWLASYPGEGAMGIGGPYEQARAALAKARGEA
jgi:hypothetical protein